MARTTPKPPTRKVRNWSVKRLAARSTAPSALSSSKPNCAPIRAAAPTVLWNAGRSSTTPASASIRAATSPATRRRARRWATWRKASNAIRNWNPSSPTASRNSASHLNQAAGSDRNWPSLTASTLAEAGASEFDPSDLPPSLRHATMSRTTLLPAVTACPVWSQKLSETAGRRQRGYARTRPYHPLENRAFPDWAVPVHHLPQDRRRHVPAADQDQRQRERLA